MDLALLIVVVNMVGAAIAGAVNMWAAWRTTAWIGRVFLGIATLSLTYAFSYFWLSFHMDKVAEWSAVMRPISILTWGVAWAIEPIVLVRYLDRKASEMQMSAIQKIVEATSNSGEHQVVKADE